MVAKRVPNVGARPTFGLLGWLRLKTGALSAAPNMSLAGPPGALCLCCRAGGSGSPNIPLLFPPTQSITNMRDMSCSSDSIIIAHFVTINFDCMLNYPDNFVVLQTNDTDRTYMELGNMLTSELSLIKSSHLSLSALSPTCIRKWWCDILYTYYTAVLTPQGKNKQIRQSWWLSSLSVNSVNLLTVVWTDYIPDYTRYSIWPAGGFISDRENIYSVHTEIIQLNNTFHTMDIDKGYDWPTSAYQLALACWSDLEDWSAWVHSGTPLVERRV